MSQTFHSILASLSTVLSMFTPAFCRWWGAGSASGWDSHTLRVWCPQYSTVLSIHTTTLCKLRHTFNIHGLYSNTLQNSPETETLELSQPSHQRHSKHKPDASRHTTRTGGHLGIVGSEAKPMEIMENMLFWDILSLFLVISSAAFKKTGEVHRWLMAQRLRMFAIICPMFLRISQKFWTKQFPEKRVRHWLLWDISKH